jgi:hypothetical protein
MLIVAGLIMAMTMVSVDARIAKPADAAMAAHQTSRLSSLPLTAQSVARSVVVLSDAQGYTMNAFLIGPRVLVTPDAVPTSSPVVARFESGAILQATLVTHDDATGMSILTIPTDEPDAQLVGFSRSSEVTALAPRIEGGWEWASTSIGAPMPDEHGVARYPSSVADETLHGVPGAVAVTNDGAVEAVLSSDGEWYSALDILAIATIDTFDGDCHATLDAQTVNAAAGVEIEGFVDAKNLDNAFALGDVITALDGLATPTASSLAAALYLHPGGTPAVVSVLRDGRALQLVVPLVCAT